MNNLTALVIELKKRVEHKKIEAKDIRLTLEILSDAMLEEGGEEIKKLLFKIGLRRMKGDQYE